MQAAKITNYTLSPGAHAAAHQDIPITLEPIAISVIAGATGQHLKITNDVDAVEATTDDYLLPNGTEVEFEISRALNRISIYNDTGGTVKSYIALSSI